MGEVLMGVITREESERIRTRLSLPLREYLPHADCHQALDSLENLRARLESAQAARRDAQESRFTLIVENEELGADLAATRTRLESAEHAEKAAAIWEQRCSQATALSGKHLGDLAAALRRTEQAERERDALRARLESTEGALRFYADLENWTPEFCKCQQHPCPIHTDQGWRARAALTAAGERSEG